MLDAQSNDQLPPPSRYSRLPSVRKFPGTPLQSVPPPGLHCSAFSFTLDLFHLFWNSSELRMAVISSNRLEAARTGGREPSAGFVVTRQELNSENDGRHREEGMEARYRDN